MSIMISGPDGSTSAHLLEATIEAFTTTVLPALREHYPQIVDDILVTVTSSVAYGTADPLSDLDVFIIFRRHNDYLRYGDRVDALIQGLNLNATHAHLCDKGLRFELESLHRADLSNLYRNPRSSHAWAEQTEWLLFWALNSVPIHDPSGMRHRLRETCSWYPPAGGPTTADRRCIAYAPLGADRPPPARQ
jgi:predicted nucleotidyltransferase